MKILAIIVLQGTLPDHEIEFISLWKCFRVWFLELVKIGSLKCRIQDVQLMNMATSSVWPIR